ncbi:phosphatidylserine/phosphatidylglycerophosphate/cardiolipin synthase family protein [Candidatus Saccharibacteria bacterium]|nr:phosphatidylserine/phosphatidylglycerophosphate/cardiolipin synthase family protein [Candidatus Saccharibacteria bacterium]
MSTPKLLVTADYISDAIKTITAAKQRVIFMSLMFTDDDATDDFVDALEAAAKRGVSVQIAADVFTYGELGGHFLPYKFYTKKSRATTRTVKELTKLGITFNWLGRFSVTPVTGRTHIKCLVVDDTVYSFGGVNLYGKDITGNSDYMFICKDARLADDLTHEFNQITKADRGRYTYRSHKFSYGKHTILTDGGFQGDSIIYRRVCELAREASDILLVSQYCPTGKLSRILKSKSSRLYFNPPQLAGPINKAVITLGMLFSQQKTSYTRDRYLHAKFMIFTMPGGNKIAVTGSHNFVYGGVLLGTREIALETDDPKIVRQLERFFETYVA